MAHIPGGPEFLASKRKSQFLNPEQKRDQKQSFRQAMDLTKKALWNLEPGENPRSLVLKPNLIVYENGLLE